MFKNLALLAAITLAMITPAFALTIAEGQQQHADAKAAGYSFVNPSLNVSVGTLKTTGSNFKITGSTPSWNSTLNTDGICGIFDDTVMVGGKPFCIWNNQTTHDANRDHGHATSTGGTTCTTNTETYTVNPAADRAHAVTRSDASSTASGHC